MCGVLITHSMSPEVLWVHVLGYWFVTHRVTLALWCYLSLTAAKAEDRQCLVKLTVQNGEVEEQEGKMCGEVPTSQKPSGMTSLSSCSVPSHPEGTMPSAPGYHHPSLFALLKCIFQENHGCRGLHPPSTQLIFSSEDKLLLTLTEIKGKTQTAGAWRKKGGTKEASL